jgi:hypothetical protein
MYQQSCIEGPEAIVETEYVIYIMYIGQCNQLYCLWINAAMK